MGNAVEAFNLTKVYGNIVAVDHINFDVQEGEVFGFLGPNGAGKTTTIRMLTGLTPPSEGTAKIFGHDIRSEILTAKRYMGIVPEISNVYDDLSAWDNLIFTAELCQVDKSERLRRAKELLEMFGLYERRDDKARSFSKGMKRRLALSMGLISNPRLLFLDEPMSGLDVQSVLIIKRVIRELNKRGVTIFLTTHDIEEANVICDRVAIMHKGEIAAIDAPERLKKTIQSVQSIEVAFHKSSPQILKELEKLPSINEVRKEGDKFRLYTHDPPSALWDLWEYARANNLKPITINTLGPSLEDVFIRLTGIKVSVGRENL